MSYTILELHGTWSVHSLKMHFMFYDRIGLKFYILDPESILYKFHIHYMCLRGLSTFKKSRALVYYEDGGISKKVLQFLQRFLFDVWWKQLASYENCCNFIHYTKFHAEIILNLCVTIIIQINLIQLSIVIWCLKNVWFIFF